MRLTSKPLHGTAVPLSSLYTVHVEPTSCRCTDEGHSDQSPTWRPGRRRGPPSHRSPRPPQSQSRTRSPPKSPRPQLCRSRLRLLILDVSFGCRTRKLTDYDRHGVIAGGAPRDSASTSRCASSTPTAARSTPSSSPSSCRRGGVLCFSRLAHRVELLGCCGTSEVIAADMNFWSDPHTSQARKT